MVVGKPVVNIVLLRFLQCVFAHVFYLFDRTPSSVCTKASLYRNIGFHCFVRGGKKARSDLVKLF